MTDKKDGSGKPAERGAAEQAGAKRPFATIDLKAVEVPPDAGKAGAAADPKPPQPAQHRTQ
jgi:hypothetical protein